MLNLASLTNSNVFKDTENREDAADQPTFTSGNKVKALKELVASLPQEYQSKDHSDDKCLMQATREFNGHKSCCSDQKGGWIVKGMKSSLTHYQVLGSAFMRKRENCGQEPRGGLCADAMGLGKTVMMV